MQCNLTSTHCLPCHAGAEAALLVPRILTVLTGSGYAAKPARTAFARGWEGVPLRFMLPWAAQMLTLLDADGGEVLLPALMVSCAAAEVLHIMPALLFPLKVSRPDTVSRHILPKIEAGCSWRETSTQSLAPFRLHLAGSSRCLVALRLHTQKACMVGKHMSLICYLPSDDKG